MFKLKIKTLVHFLPSVINIFTTFTNPFSLRFVLRGVRLKIMQKIFITFTFFLVFISTNKVNAQCKAIADYLIYDSTNTTLFYNQGSSGAGYGYVWDFGDGTGKSTTERAVHKYAKAGTYKVTFIVYNTSLKCADTTYLTIVDKGKNPCNAQFTVVQDKSNPLTYHYSAKDSTQDNYEWWSPAYGYKKNLTHTFSSEGSYQAILYVQSSKNHCIDTVKKYLYAKNCGADFSASVDQSTKKVTFTNKSSSSTVHFYWSFGDGSGWDTLKNPTYTYSKPGKYWVTLVVWNKSYSCMDSTHLIITVNGCDADFTINQVSKSSGIYRLKSPYKASSSIKHTWYIGTKTSWTGDSLILNFGSSSGSVTVCHKLIDTINNCSDSVCKKVVYGKTACDSSFSYRVSNDSLYFTYTGSSTKALRWVFGDGNHVDTGIHVTQGVYVYKVTGLTYNFCLQSYCTPSTFSSNCVQVFINVKCDANYTYQPDSTNKLKINFYNKYPAKTQHKWYFGDGKTSTSENPIYTYSTPKSYNVCHVIYDSIYKKGCYDSTCQTVTVNGSNCDTGFYYSIKGDSLKFYYAGKASKVKWDFGDGSIDTTSILGSHVYKKTGIYTVCLTTWCAKKAQKCTTIIIGCVSDFNVSTKDTTITFYTSVLKPKQKCKWTFSDGQQLRDTSNGVHHFKRSCFYRICLTIYCSSIDSAVFCLTVGNVVLTSKFTYAKDINASKVVFTNQSSINVTNYLWRFGDGNTSTAKNPTHTYSNSGGYTVSLESYDSIKKCKDSMTEFIELYECKSLFTLALDTTQKFKLYLINKSSSYNSNKYYWSFGDGTFSNQKNPTHKYNKFGKFEISLTVKDSSKIQNCSTKYCDTIGLDSNGRLLKAGGWELIVIDEKVFGVKKIVKSDFKIYPNPANTKVTIDLSNTTNSYQKLEVLNANGQVCIVQPIEKGSETMEVDLERISRGLYLIKLSNDDGYSYRKLMKN